MENDQLSASISALDINWQDFMLFESSPAMSVSFSLAPDFNQITPKSGMAHLYTAIQPWNLRGCVFNKCVANDIFSL